jgi:membrane associated rhomboid family serine protease
MGIYDREYVRVGPRSQSGLGSLRFISVNSWIIIINVVVFLLGRTLFSQPSEWVVQAVYGERVTDAQKAMAQVDRSTTLAASARYPTYSHPIYAPVLGADGRPVIGPMNRPIVDRVGQELFLRMPLLEGLGHFSTLRGFFGLELWRFITFQFLHANGTHIFFNMFGLWVFGGMVEQYLGSRRYAAFYLTCGIFGAVSYLLLNLLGHAVQHAWPGAAVPGVLIDEIWTPLVGASAGVFGVILACAYIAPDAIILVYLVPLRLKIFAYGYVALAAINLLRGGANAGGDAAHMGGAIAGFFFIRNAHLLRDFFDVFGGRGESRPPGGGEVDRILDKVQGQGLASLTPAEKRTLRQATERQRRA